ncbi:MULTISPECIES: sugar ABC transporter substrate-binding protein [Streptomyces]|uniref:sugar ABC transporter substrate-binding protein n=1 Tax=Streptomyces TaxID=1883 RepID=UPI002F90D716|nr:sugar ABC transporter substrate-binding protein [Streptomyces chartreusis]WTA33486.1 sugar ABC transporter substrate-binding protein [Streptomyces chartreusis]
MKSVIRATVASLAALAMAAGVAGCGASQEATGKAGDKQVSVSMGLVLTGLKYFQEEKSGAEAFAAEDGNVDLEITGPPGFDPELAQKQVRDLLAKGPDAMGISPQPPDTWLRTMQELSTQLRGNVIAYSEVPASTPKDVSRSPIRTVVGNDDRRLSREMLEKTIKLSGLDKSTTGPVVLAPCTPDKTGTGARRLAGFVDAVKELLPKTNIVTFVTTPTNRQENYELWADKLSAYPNAVLAAGTCGDDGNSLYRLKQKKGYKYALGAMELTPESLTGLKDGSILAVQTANTWVMGYTVARMLTLAARGEKLPEGFVATGGTLFTKDNADQGSVRDEQPEKFFRPVIDKLFANGMPEAQPIENAWK